MLRAILNMSWKQHPTKQQLYGYIQPIMQTIQVRRTRVQDTAGEIGMISCDILLWTPSHGRKKAWQAVRTYIQQICAVTGCSVEDLPGAMDYREGWGKRVREIHTGGLTWWWWWYGQGATVGHFLSRLQLVWIHSCFFSARLTVEPWLKNQIFPTTDSYLDENVWIHAFSLNASVKGKSHILVPNDSSHRLHFFLG